MDEHEFKRLELKRLLHHAGFLPRGLRRKLRVARRFRLRVAVALLTLALGIGADTYVRYEANRSSHCFGCGSWACEIELMADHPLLYARVLWDRLTD